jgi:hypothetical protein
MGSIPVNGLLVVALIVVTSSVNTIFSSSLHEIVVKRGGKIKTAREIYNAHLAAFVHFFIFYLLCENNQLDNKKSKN